MTEPGNKILIFGNCFPDDTLCLIEQSPIPGKVPNLDLYRYLMSLPIDSVDHLNLQLSTPNASHRRDRTERREVVRGLCSKLLLAAVFNTKLLFPFLVEQRFSRPCYFPPSRSYLLFCRYSHTSSHNSNSRTSARRECLLVWPTQFLLFS